MTEREPYSPKWAPHVEGWHEPRREALPGEPPDAQKVGARCAVCGNTFEYRCTSGRVRWRINLWAQQHLHRDRLAPTPKEKT